MPRIDRGDCPTIQANDARDLTRSGRVTLDRVDDAAYAVDVDGERVGVVIRSAKGWVAGRPGWHDPHVRSKRSTAVRRLLMSHPRGTFDRTPAATVAGEGNTEGGTSR